MSLEISSVTGVSLETAIAHSTSRRCAPGLRRFPLHGKRPRGSAPMSEVDGHEVAVARSIERMRGSTRVIDGRPSPRNGARKDVLTCQTDPIQYVRGGRGLLAPVDSRAGGIARESTLYWVGLLRTLCCECLFSQALESGFRSLYHQAVGACRSGDHPALSLCGDKFR